MDRPDHVDVSIPKTMVSSLRNSPMESLRAVQWASHLAVLSLAWLAMASPTIGQSPAIHYRHAGPTPPGAIGRQQLARGGPLRGYYQPVEIKAPHGTLISPASGGEFQASQWAPLTVGMLIGEVYRFRVTGIPRNEGFEVYPTIEVIDRLYPPEGQKTRFPIPVELTLEELELALSGKMVTRVIYVEPPRTALPRPEDPTWQRYFEVLPGETPLQIADQLGRPVAILRMGSRLPGNEGPDEHFLYGSPPIERYFKQPGGLPSVASKFQSAPVPLRAVVGAGPSPAPSPSIRFSR